MICPSLSLSLYVYYKHIDRQSKSFFWPTYQHVGILGGFASSDALGGHLALHPDECDLELQQILEPTLHNIRRNVVPHRCTSQFAVVFFPPIFASVENCKQPGPRCIGYFYQQSESVSGPLGVVAWDWTPCPPQLGLALSEAGRITRNFEPPPFSLLLFPLCFWVSWQK